MRPWKCWLGHLPYWDHSQLLPRQLCAKCGTVLVEVPKLVHPTRTCGTCRREVDAWKVFADGTVQCMPCMQRAN